MKLYAREEGAGPETIVFLHGFGCTHDVWRGCHGAFSGQAKTIAYDLPGHGGSVDHPDAGPPKGAVRAILADLDERNISSVHLVGHSMGGAIATLIALKRPAMVRSMTLLAPGGFGPEINLRLLARNAAASNEHDVRAVLESMFGFLKPLPEEVVSSTLADRQVPGRAESLTRIVATLGSDGRQGELPRESLAELPMPVSVAWGGLDNVLPARHSEGLPPNFTLHFFPDLGHMLPEEAPELMIPIVRATVAIPT